MRYAQFTDAQLLAESKFEAFRGSGPGGQKKNKTSSAVRISHIPTGVSVVASESRSQHKNRAVAIVRLRHKLVLEHRNTIDIAAELPAWFSQAPAGKRLDIGRRSEQYLPTMELILDVLCACSWSVSDAARALGVTTGHLVQFLRSDEKLWGEVNRQRQVAGLRPLIGER